MQIGQMINNRYEILEEIGGGGMAVVYKAKCHVLHRIVAVKVLRPEYTQDEEFVRKFKLEAQAAASLSHPNIVGIYDVGNDGDIYYIIMEYVEGVTLKDLIKERGALSHKETVRIGAQICDALAIAHANKIIHRDVKPHNILVTKNGQVKVTDFGIARAVTAQTVTLTGSIIGSVHYFSPEQARGGIVGAKSDIYSLGIVLYEMISGKLPFDGESPISVALKHIQNDPVPPMTVNPNVPKSMNDIILKALNKDENRRFGNILELKHDLVKSLQVPEGWYEEEPEMAAGFGAAFGEEEDLQAYKDTTRRRIEEDDDDEEDEDEEEEYVPVKKKKAKKKKKKKNGEGLSLPAKIGIGIALALLLMALGYFGFSMAQRALKVPEAEVPKIVGMTLEEAEEELAKSNLKLEVEETVFDDEVEEGRIISQDPEEGTKVKVENPIRVVVSGGQEMVEVPQVTNEDLKTAQLMLEKEGLQVGQVKEEYSSEVQENKVIRQTPEAGESVVTNTIVDLVISKGKEPEKILLENYEGQKRDEVVKTLSLYNLETTIKEVESYEYEAGIVISQSPKKGTILTEGDKVTLTVSKGPGPKKKTEQTIMVNLPSEPEKVTVTVYMTDDLGKKEILNKEKTPADSPLLLKVEMTGNAIVEIYVDGQLYDKKTLIAGE